MNKVTGWAMSAALALSVNSALAEDLVVVELYTSQGCSSCPPADALLAELTHRSDVLPLALHVDYWDYIGWADSYAHSDFTTRQKAYAHAAGARTIYTPQMVVGGQDHLVGTHAAELEKLISMHLEDAAPVGLTLHKAEDQLIITIEPRDTIEQTLAIQLIRFIPHETVSIRRGENAGRTLSYYNIVTDWRQIGQWSGEDSMQMETPLEGDLPIAVILQTEGHGAILAAARLDN